jgi:hypothetical protein
MIRDGRLSGRLRRRTADIAPVPAHLPQHRAGQPRVYPGVLSAPVEETAPAASAPVPSFSAKTPRPTAETAPIRVPSRVRPYAGGDPLDRATAVRTEVAPVIGDSLAARAVPAGPWQSAVPYGPERGPVPATFSGPGWAGRLMSIRVRNGEWTDVQALAEQGLGRNAADEAAARRHFSSTVAEGVLQRCSVIGHPELAGLLLQRTQELVMAARAQKAGAQ